MVLTCCLSLTSHAQPSIDILQFRQDYHLPTTYDNRQTAGAEDRSLRQYNIRLLLPPPINENKDRLLLGGEYANFEFRSHGPDAVRQRAHFQWLEIHLGYRRQWHGGRHEQSTQVVFIPKWSSDGPLFTNEAFQFGGSILHKWRFSDDLEVGGGAFVFNESFGVYVAPLLSIDWRMKNDWFLYGTLLGNMRLTKRINSKFELSASYWGPGNSINTTRLPGSYVRIVKGIYSVWKMDVRWYFSDFLFFGEEANTYLQLSAGHTVDRRLDLYDVNDEIVHEGVFNSYGDGPFVSVTLAMRVKN